MQISWQHTTWQLPLVTSDYGRQHGKDNRQQGRRQCLCPLVSSESDNPTAADEEDGGITNGGNLATEKPVVLQEVDIQEDKHAHFFRGISPAIPLLLQQQLC